MPSAGAMQVSDEAADVLRQLLFSNIRRRVVVVRAQGPSPSKAGKMKLKRGPESAEPTQKVCCLQCCQELSAAAIADDAVASLPNVTYKGTWSCGLA